MSIEVKVPPLPESVTDATLVAWHHKPGDSVRRDENLVDLETDKVVLEVPAPSDGVLKEIRISDGTTVTSGEILAVLEPGEVAAAQASATGESAAEDSSSDAAPESKPDSQPGADGSSASAAAPAGEGSQRMGPAVRALVEEHDLDPAKIKATGRDGRLTKSDVLNHIESSDQPRPAAQSSADTDAGAYGRSEQRVAMTRLRARVAERLVEVQQNAALLTTFNEIDMSAIVALRKKYQDDFVKRHEIKLGFMSFFVRATIEALRAYPVLNAAVDGSDIVYHEYFDIGVAVSTDRGLLVPVIRDAHLLSLAGIEKTIADYGQRARTGDIGMEELTGGTFTITNGGIFGSMMSTPILNPPQSGIRGMHAITRRPMVVDGEIVARPMM
ncbi:MAG TPA: 2-oxoglutarate dehydrogenase complex dihydrolipoyllysine-residue succinyltransferase, partial [Gammaproteobacteria bacterium]|nr:2-oxoglutarate dehydrogenase complex dihydrolipoyllysine-residue succinyltransferase [Gammaproteobacteria bacterium]